MSNGPVVTKRGLLDCQVCVPKDWSDKQVIEFAERENPCGTMNGWFIRRGAIRRWPVRTNGCRVSNVKVSSTSCWTHE